MTITIFQIFAAVIIWLITLAAGYKPLRASKLAKTNYQTVIGEAFASGVFLGAALFHMLPDAIGGFSKTFGHYNYPYAISLCVFAFMCLFILEWAFSVANKKRRSQNIVAYLLTFVLSIHALLTGIAFGINQTLATASIIFIAIIAHKGSESFALATELYRSQLKFILSTTIFLIFSLMTPIGILFGATVSHIMQGDQDFIAQSIFNAIAAGTFIYIAFMHTGIASGRSAKEIISLFTGLIIMALVAIWL